MTTATLDQPPATSPVDHPANPTQRRLLWALIGGGLILNSVLLHSFGSRPGADLHDWLRDGGKLAAICAGIGVIVLLWRVLEIIVREASTGQASMNELVILAVLASITRANFTDNGALALQTAGGIAFFLLITLIIESQSAVGARTSLEALAKLTPGKARRLIGETEELVEPKALTAGDRLRILPGENVFADGRIVKGITALQEANITGESLPVDKEPGDAVFAGTVNLSGLIEVEVERAGTDTTIGRVRELIAEAEKSRLPFTRLIDQYVKYYTPVVLMVAILVWLATYDINRVAALLVAACPIALILATPSAMIAALSAAARLGILIKNVNDIEAMSRIDAFVMDKTGTVTTGELGVVRLAPVEGVKPGELVRLAASAEQRSNHPVAITIRDLAGKVRVTLSEPSALHEEPGRGLRATVDGQEVLVGNLAWMQQNGLQEDDFVSQENTPEEGVSLLFAMCDGKPLGWIALEDQVRPDAAAAIAELRQQRVDHIAMVTGDREEVAVRVAADLAITNYEGGCIPSEKVDYVETIKQRGYRVAFVGDGVNDAPALAASHIGIAMGAAGSDVAVESATIALLNNRLDRLPFLLKLARQARLVILGNVIIGGIFIIGGIALSAAGVLSPMVAAIIQVVSTLAVVLNSARLVRQGEDLA